MFSLKKSKKKGGITGLLIGIKQIFTVCDDKNFQTKFFSLRNVICIRMCEIRESIACPLFSRRGSLTVETALILPVFLIASLTLLSFIDVMKMTMEQQMWQQNFLRNSAVYANLLGTVVEGREGDYIKVDYVYPVTLPIGGFGYKKVFVRQKSMIHIFNGYDDSYGDRVGEQQEYVYVTERGSVYHKKRSCQALNISVREITGKNVKAARNIDGKKYTKCWTCAKEYNMSEQKNMQLYITDYGTNFHARVNCRDLTRTVRVIRIEDTGGKPVCRWCD